MKKKEQQSKTKAVNINIWGIWIKGMWEKIFLIFLQLSYWSEVMSNKKFKKYFKEVLLIIFLKYYQLL